MTAVAGAEVRAGIAQQLGEGKTMKATATYNAVYYAPMHRGGTFQDTTRPFIAVFDADGEQVGIWELLDDSYKPGGCFRRSQHCDMAAAEAAVRACPLPTEPMTPTTWGEQLVWTPERGYHPASVRIL